MHKKQISPKIICGVIVVIVLFLLLLFGALKSTDSLEIIDVKIEIVTSSGGSSATDEEGNEVVEHPYELKYTIAVKNTGFTALGDIYEGEFLEAIIIPNKEFDYFLNTTFDMDIFDEETLRWNYDSTGVGGDVISKHNDIGFLEVTYGLGYDESTYQHEEWPAPTEEKMEALLQNAYDVTALLYISNGEHGRNPIDTIEEEIGYFDLSEGYNGSRFGNGDSWSGTYKSITSNLNYWNFHSNGTVEWETKGTYVFEEREGESIIRLISEDDTKDAREGTTYVINKVDDTTIQLIPAIYFFEPELLEATVGDSEPISMDDVTLKMSMVDGTSIYGLTQAVESTYNVLHDSKESPMNYVFHADGTYEEIVTLKYTIKDENTIKIGKTKYQYYLDYENDTLELQAKNMDEPLVFEIIIDNAEGFVNEIRQQYE